MHEAYTVQHSPPADRDAKWHAGEAVRRRARGGGTADVRRQTHGVPGRSWGACALPKLPFDLKMGVSGKTERENNAKLKLPSHCLKPAASVQTTMSYNYVLGIHSPRATREMPTASSSTNHWSTAVLS